MGCKGILQVTTANIDWRTTCTKTRTSKEHAYHRPSILSRSNILHNRLKRQNRQGKQTMNISNEAMGHTRSQFIEDLRRRYPPQYRCHHSRQRLCTPLSYYSNAGHPRRRSRSP